MITVLKNGHLNSVSSNNISFYNFSSVVDLCLPVPKKILFFMEFIQCAVTSIPRQYSWGLISINCQASFLCCEIPLWSLNLPYNVGYTTIELDLSVDTLWIIDHWPRMMSLDIGTYHLNRKLERSLP